MYNRPMILAQSMVSGSYAAGCPADALGAAFCKRCDRTAQCEKVDLWLLNADVFFSHIYFIRRQDCYDKSRKV